MSVLSATSTLGDGTNTYFSVTHSVVSNPVIALLNSITQAVLNASLYVLTPHAGWCELTFLTPPGVAAVTIAVTGS